mmetsp:Transcript_94912/g.171421  ORF Transcript_94912/g.171421 Transcript_94912/m.171421 type:complete len:89 (+) Transcript_94912:325-591(+)
MEAPTSMEAQAGIASTGQVRVQLAQLERGFLQQQRLVIVSWHVQQPQAFPAWRTNSQMNGVQTKEQAALVRDRQLQFSPFPEFNLAKL